MERHEDTITQSWNGKKAKERKRLLQKHWPGIASSHRPDLQVLMKRKPNDDFLPDPSYSAERSSPTAGNRPVTVDASVGDEGSLQSEQSPLQKRDAVLWPYMTLDDLRTDSKYLTQMLHSRGRNSRDYFALQDMPPARQEFLELFIRFKAVPDSFTIIEENNYAYSDIDAGDNSYGQLVSIQDHEIRSKAIADKVIMHAGPGLVLLEVQERLYNFLLNLAKSLLKDKPDILIGQGVMKKKVSKIPSQGPQHQRVSSMADWRREAPYTGLAAQYYTTHSRDLFSSQNLRVVRGKCYEAFDHWTLLRVDPGYLFEAVSKWKDYRLEVLHVHTQGSVDPSVHSSSHLIWCAALRACVLTALQKLVHWDEAYRRVFFVRYNQIRSRNELMAGKQEEARLDRIGEDVHRDLARCLLYSFCSKSEEAVVRHLNQLWSYSPRLRPYFGRVVQPNPSPRPKLPRSQSSCTLVGVSSEDPPGADPDGGSTEDSSALHPTENTSKNETEDHGKGIKVEDHAEVNQIEDNAKPQSERLPNHMQKSHSWQHLEWLFNGLFDTRVRNLIGMQTILDEIELHGLSSPDKLRLMSDLVHWQFSDLATISEVYDREFKSAVDSEYSILRMTAKLKSALQDEERMFEDKFLGGCEIEGTTVKGAVTFEGSIHMWSSGVPTEGVFDYPVDKPLKTEQDRRQLESAEKAHSYFWNAFDRELKAQTKWRDTESVNALYFPVPAPPKPQHSKGPEDKGKQSSGEVRNRKGPFNICLDVDQRALNVFKTMFVAASGEWHPKPLPWEDFEHALCQADYEVNLLYGRARLFTPPMGMTGSHMFRMPTPGNKMSVAMLRQYGLRMNLHGQWSFDYSKFRLRKVPEKQRDATEKNSAVGDKRVLEAEKALEELLWAEEEEKQGKGKKAAKEAGGKSKSKKKKKK